MFEPWFFMFFGVFHRIFGIKTFLKNLHHNYWWRWIYIFGGSYVLFDLFAIATGLEFWHKLILQMYDISASYWNILWILLISAFRQLSEAKQKTTRYAGGREEVIQKLTFLVQ